MSSKLEKITLRHLNQEDFPQLVDWINAPHVAKFWDGLTNIEDVREKYGPRISSETKTHVFIANFDSTPIGMIQCYKHSDSPDWDRTVAVPNAIGIDYMIGNPMFVGRGIGPLIIEKMVQLAFEIYPDCAAIVSVPQQANRASCLALEKAGFVLKESRKLDSDCPSDAGISSIYVRSKTETNFCFTP